MTTGEPMDPMWATFRRAHPEVTLVLLPGSGSSDASARSTEAVPASFDEAQADMATLKRRVELIASVLGVDGTAIAGWQRAGDRIVRPHVSWVPARAGGVDDAEYLVARLEGLGWKAKVRTPSNPLLIDATMSGSLMRVIGADAGVSLRASGELLDVGEQAAQKLVESGRQGDSNDADNG